MGSLLSLALPPYPAVLCTACNSNPWEAPLPNSKSECIFFSYNYGSQASKLPLEIRHQTYVYLLHDPVNTNLISSLPGSLLRSFFSTTSPQWVAVKQPDHSGFLWDINSQTNHQRLTRNRKEGGERFSSRCPSFSEIQVDLIPASKVVLYQESIDRYDTTSDKSIGTMAAEIHTLMSLTRGVTTSGLGYCGPHGSGVFLHYSYSFPSGPS